MENNKFIRMVEDQLNIENGIMEKKGQDYTIGNEDRLYNFKLVAELVGITPKQVLMVYWLKHVLSLLNHARGGKESEPIDGRIADVRNYALLYKGLVLEEDNRAGHGKVNGFLYHDRRNGNDAVKPDTGEICSLCKKPLIPVNGEQCQCNEGI
jgi:hypothetical protein